MLWWEDDTLCLPPPQLPILAGVTTGLIQERALHSGIRMAHRERTLEQLAGREVWLVNALHGIRPVTGWEGRPMEAGQDSAPRNGGNGWTASWSPCRLPDPRLSDKEGKGSRRAECIRPGAITHIRIQ